MITNLTIGRYGRFGNALFQIAAVIGIARKSGHEFGFRPFVNHDHKERFGSTEDVELDKYFTNQLPGLDGFSDGNFHEVPYQWGYEYHSFGDGLWNITGHFQSEKYFKHCIDEVRHYFRMNAEIPEDGWDNVVAIHVRRGDYDNLYHTILTEKYYSDALKIFPASSQFFIFTDDVDAVKKSFKNIGNYNIRFSMRSYIHDFAIMKQCGGFICANSSYSLMAAILSEAPNKKIICPSNWFGPAWNPDTKDLYPEGAIVI